ncbi:MAG TPA: hypothetical protein VMZ74_04165 [Ramlibacter sp.]|nr:hypothetical protein [Ramlibacter sp.]
MSHTCVLLVALVGFEAKAERRLALLLDDCSALGARWRVVREGAADLWIVDGASAHSAGRGLIHSGSVRFRPAEMPHPVAFAEPLHESISTGHRFDPESIHSLNVLLTQLARWLMPKLVQQALVAQLVANGASFTRSNVIEVQHHGRVLAVLDFEGDTAVGADVTPADLRRAHWALRERGKVLVPPGFRITTTEHVLWQFAMRCDAVDLLPQRYTRLPIYLRRTPAIAPRELADRQLRIVREIAYGPRTLAELGEFTGASPQALARDLGALYLIGAITCDPGRSRAVRERRSGADVRAQEDLSMFGARPKTIGDLTAPGLVPSTQRAAARMSTH